MRYFPLRWIRTLLVFGWLWLALSPASAAAAQSVLVLGDSISAAYGMSLEQGWVALLERQLSRAGRPVRIVNASISGETSDGGLRRLPALLERHRPDLVIVELGANDGLRGFPLQRLRDNLAAIVETAQQAHARVLLLPMEIPPNYGARYTADFRRSFEQVAADTGAALAPFILREFATDPDYLQPDGIHPTAAAQPLMLDTILPAVLGALPGA